MKILFLFTVVILNNLVRGWIHNRDQYLTHDVILSLLQKPETERFLMGFNSSYQRWILTKQLEYCPFTPLCTFSFGLKPATTMGSCCRNCDCKFPQCLEKKTCCPDKLFQNIEVSNDTFITVHDLQSHTGANIHKTCIPLYLSNGDANLPDIEHNAFGYATCPPETSDYLWQNCTRPYTNDIDSFADLQPVKSKVTNDIYRNRYCAYCHNITDNEFQPLQKKLTCGSVTPLGSPKRIINEVLSNDMCTLTFMPDTRLDFCIESVSTCNKTGLWTVSNSHVDRACALYSSAIRSSNGTQYYRNIFCSQCNGIKQSDLQCKVDPGSPGPDEFPFSGLLKLDRRDSAFKPNKISDSCSENQIYDTIWNKCRDLFCPVHMELSQGECIDIFETIDRMFYMTFIRITPPQNLFLSQYIDISDAVFQYIGQWLTLFGMMRNLQMVFQTTLPFSNQSRMMGQTENISVLYYDVRVQFCNNNAHKPNSVIEKIMNVYNFSVLQDIGLFEVQVIDGVEKPFDRISSIPETTSLSSIFTNIGDSLESSDVETLIEEYAFPGYRDMLAFPYLKEVNVRLCDFEPFNLLWLRSCPKVNISNEEFPWTITTTGIIVQPGNYLLKNGDFYFADEKHIMVCVEQYKELLSNARVLPSSESSYSVATVISVVCSSLSILSLVISFIIFSCFPMLRHTIPGKNNMSLVLCLLIAQILYMVSSIGRLDTKSIECSIIGLLVHLFWLLAIFWMNICTFHVFRVLSKTKIISKSTGLRRFIFYHFYAILLTAGCVGVNIAVSYTQTGDIGYGGTICYISSQQMINYTFVLPTAFVVVSNMSMFLFLIIKIKRTSSIQKNVQRERNDLYIFAKLSTVTGITWIFGVLYAWTDMVVFSYLFIILNACQGVFIMFAFTVNKRILDLLKAKMPGITPTGSIEATHSSNASNSRH